MHLGHFLSKQRLLVPRPQALFAFGVGFGLLALRQPHVARHSRVPSFFGPRKQFAAKVRALYVRIHTFYLKFLQGHT